MPVEAISKTAIPHVTRIVQLSDKDNNLVKVSHKHFKDEAGKEVFKDTCDINNPNGSDIKKFLNHIEYGSGQSPESEIFKRVMEHINGIEAGEIKNDLPKTSSVKEAVKETVKESKSDFSDLKFPKEGMKISNNELKEAAFAMKQDIAKDKSKE